MNPTKRETLFAHLRKPLGAFVYLDPRRAGVVVPEHLRAQHQLVLQLGLQFQRPIPDLELTDAGITATLSFRGVRFHCTIPWSAVYAIRPSDAERGIVWHDDTPAEIRALLDEQPRGAA